ncbi:MAG: glycosyltransferase family 4 protein [Acidobacteriota bacterium]
MRVGFVCREYPAIDPHHGGVGAAVETLARSLVEAGHRVRVFAIGERDETIENGEVEVRCLPYSGVLTTALRVRRLLRSELASGELDVIETSEAEAHLLPGGPGSVVRMNGSHHFWCAHLDQQRRWGRLALEQWGVRRAGGLCAVSSFAGEETRRLMRLGTRPIEVLPNPIDTGFFHPDPKSVQPGRVVFVGTVTPKKGVLELCLAFEALRGEQPEAELRLLGRDDGPPGDCTRDRILEALSDWGRERIQFLGAQSRDVVAIEMRRAQLCAFPSYMETQGIVVGEALASGRPAVAASVGPGPETLGQPPAGWTAGPQDVPALAVVLSRALENPRLCDELGARGRHHIEKNYSSESLLERTLRFYQSHSATS